MQEMMPLSSRCDMPRYASAYAYLYRQSIECTGACQFGRIFFFFFSFFFFFFFFLGVFHIFIHGDRRGKYFFYDRVARSTKSHSKFLFFFPFVLSFHRWKTNIKIKYLFMDSLLVATHWPVNLSHAENAFWWVRLSRSIGLSLAITVSFLSIWPNSSFFYFFFFFFFYF